VLNQVGNVGKEIRDYLSHFRAYFTLLASSLLVPTTRQLPIVSFNDELIPLVIVERISPREVDGVPKLYQRLAYVGYTILTMGEFCLLRPETRHTVLSIRATRPTALTVGYAVFAHGSTSPLGFFTDTNESKAVACPPGFTNAEVAARMETSLRLHLQNRKCPDPSQGTTISERMVVLNDLVTC
jgi:hypothetical protein